MAALLGLGIGGLFVALALGFVPMDEQLPMAIRIIFGVMGSLTVLASVNNLRFRIKHRAAIENGRQRTGIATLRGRSSDEDSSAFLEFETAYDQWLLMVSSTELKAMESDLRKGMEARATIGDDEKVYALKIKGKAVKMSGPGNHLSKKMQDMIAKAEARFEAVEKKRAA